MNEVLSQHDHGNCELCDQQEERIRTLEAEVERLREENEGLRNLIASGHSRGAEISPVIRRIFSAGSQAAKERDAAQAEVERLREEHETDEMVKKALREKNRALEARYQDEYADHQRTLVVGREEIERLQTAVARLRAALALVSEQRDGLAQGADAIWERGYNAAIEHVRAALEGPGMSRAHGTTI